MTVHWNRLGRNSKSRTACVLPVQSEMQLWRKEEKRPGVKNSKDATPAL